MYRCINIFFNKTLTEQNSILVVVTFPGHETDKRVCSESQLAVIRRRTVGNNLSGLDRIALVDDRTLVDAGSLVASREL